jgi:diguanylate cyclase (GGDEF)-like protein
MRQLVLCRIPACRAPRENSSAISSRGISRRKTSVGILFVDLDRFKIVNDTRGHGVGDALLTHVAARLRDCVRAADTVGRLGGDEFAIVLCSLAKAGDAGLVADKVVSALSRPFRLDGQDIYVSASVGIGIYPTDGKQPTSCSETPTPPCIEPRNAVETHSNSICRR